MTARTTWTAAIVGLLAVNAIAAITLAVLANHGAAQVIPDYYTKAAHYDDELDRSTISRSLGWRVDVALGRGAIDAAVFDAAGRPIEGARVRVTGYQRAHAAEPIDVVLATASAGRYHAQVDDRAGWYDLVVAVDARGSQFSRHVAAEAR